MEVAALPDPVGGIERMARQPNGLLVGRMRIPLGVIAIIYESRPNVTADAAALCVKSGNAVVLRGGSEAIRSNAAISEILRGSLAKAGLPVDAVSFIPVTDRAAIDVMLQQEESIDLVIPRGGEGLIRSVVEKSRIPVIKHYKGVCHIFVDESADIDRAVRVCVNAKAQRPAYATRWKRCWCTSRSPRPSCRVSRRRWSGPGCRAARLPGNGSAGAGDRRRHGRGLGPGIPRPGPRGGGWSPRSTRRWSISAGTAPCTRRHPDPRPRPRDALPARGGLIPGAGERIVALQRRVPAGARR